MVDCISEDKKRKYELRNTLNEGIQSYNYWLDNRMINNPLKSHLNKFIPNKIKLYIKEKSNFLRRSFSDIKPLNEIEKKLNNQNISVNLLELKKIEKIIINFHA